MKMNKRCSGGDKLAGQQEVVVMAPPQNFPEIILRKQNNREKLHHFMSLLATRVGGLDGCYLAG